MYLSHTVTRAAQVNGDGLATIFGERRRTWKQFHDRIKRLAGALVALGMKPGDRVSMLSPNSDRYVEYYYGIPWGGGVIVPLNNRWSIPELRYAIEDAGVTILFAHESFLAEAMQLKESIDCLRHIIVLSDDATELGVPDYEKLISDTEPVELIGREPEEVYGIFYTGGTTGHPKGVMLSTRGLWANVMFIIREYDYHRGENVLHVAPMFHMAAGANVFAMTGAACAHVIIPAFDTTKVLQLIEQEQVKNIPLMPTMIKMLMDDPAFYDTDLSSLRRIIYGAAPISDTLIRKLVEHLPQVEFVQVFGQTELSPIVTTLAPECHVPDNPLFEKRTSVGQAIYGTEVKIIDAEGNTLPPGETGEVAVRGPGNMLGYWNKPEQTAATFIDGWIRMGDAGYLDEEGYLYIVDRIKDMIISGAENVYCIEVENAIAKHPAVGACAVIGVPDETWGERVHAVIVLKDKASLDEMELLEHCRGLIADYKCPRSLEFVDALPLSAAGKILKTELRKPYWSDKERRVN